MMTRCMRCGESDFRPSQFRAEDLLLMVRLQFPVRCRTCHERHIVSLGGYRRIRREQSVRRAAHAIR